jgi:hypothetical protein
MKRLIFTLLLLVSALSAGAWNKSSYAAIVVLASQKLSPEAGAMIKKAVGCDLGVAEISNKALNTFSLDGDFVPLRNGEKDALLIAEQCVERLRGNKNDGEAILWLAKAFVDMHGVTNVRIKDNDFSHNNYFVRRWNNREGKLARYTKVKWRAMWDAYFPGRHHLFTPEMYAYDIDLYHGRYRTEYIKGGLADWAADVANEYRAIYAENLADMHILRQERVNEYEFIHDRLMAKAAYRLAALLNEILR